MNMKNLALLLLCALVAMTGGVADAAERSVYLVPDAQGSAVAAMDAQGAVLWRESYAPYGERRTRAAANPANPAYTGKPEDRDTGLVYMGARWYDAESARFTGNDPQGFSAGNPQTFGRYVYANNSPYVFLDPDGESAASIGGVLVIVGIVAIKEGVGLAAESACGCTLPIGIRGIGKAVAKFGEKAVRAGIVNRGGRFADLDRAKQAGEVGHHIPQNASNKAIGLSRADGPSIGMTKEDHALTRTYAGKGKASMAEDAGLSARSRLAKDILDLRSNFGSKYNQGALEAIKYAKTLDQFQKKAQ